MEEKQEFSILDSKGMNTVAFAIETDIINNSDEIHTLKMLDFEKEEEEGKTKKTFFVEVEEDTAITILMLTLGKNKVVMNSGILLENELEITKKPDIVKYEPIINKDGEYTYRDFKYTPNLKRPISIIDSITGEEIKPFLYGVFGITALYSLLLFLNSQYTSKSLL